MSDDKVIAFDKVVTVITREETDLPEPTMNVVEHGGKYCHHEKVDLFLHHRILKCKECGEIIDAYQFVFHLAREESRHISTIKWLRYQVKDIQKQKEDLERDVKNLKAQKRKLL